MRCTASCATTRPTTMPRTAHSAAITKRCRRRRPGETGCQPPSPWPLQTSHTVSTSITGTQPSPHRPRRLTLRELCAGADARFALLQGLIGRQPLRNRLTPHHERNTMTIQPRTQSERTERYHQRRQVSDHFDGGFGGHLRRSQVIRPSENVEPRRGTQMELRSQQPHVPSKPNVGDITATARQRHGYAKVRTWSPTRSSTNWRAVIGRLFTIVPWLRETSKQQHFVPSCGGTARQRAARVTAKTTTWRPPAAAVKQVDSTCTQRRIKLGVSKKLRIESEQGGRTVFAILQHGVPARDRLVHDVEIALGRAACTSEPNATGQDAGDNNDINEIHDTPKL